MGTTETEEERPNRKLIELLNELRVALPGVQVLFAFLLILPFNTGFAKVDGHAEERLHRVAPVCLRRVDAAHRTVGLPPPPVQAIVERSLEAKREMLATQDRLAIVGMAFLVAAMTLAVYVPLDVLMGSLSAFGISLCLATGLGWFWFGLPLVRRIQEEPSRGSISRPSVVWSRVAGVSAPKDSKGEKGDVMRTRIIQIDEDHQRQPLIRWGLSLQERGVRGLAVMVVLTTLWLALAFPSENSFVRDNMEWFVAGSRAAALFLAGLIAGLLTDNRGAASGWSPG